MEMLLIIFFVVSICFSFSYVLLISFYIYGWKKLKTVSYKHTDYETFISVIIPARNEESHIENCIKMLQQQDYPKELFEVIIIDDHSTDRTYDISARYSSEQLKVLRLDTTIETVAFKKKAIEECIKIAKGKLIVTTDADCSMGNKWLSEIATIYEAEKPKMIVGPVCFINERTFFEKMQSLEFISLIGSTGASLFYNKPLMCNGANLAYEKEAFIAIRGFEKHQGIATGDDMLLMLHLKETYPDSIRYIKSENAVVYTHAKRNLKSFWEQRKRWVSKSKHYTDSYVILISLLIYINNLLPLLSIILSVVYIKFIIVFIVAFGLKLWVDYIFMKDICNYFKKAYLMKLFIPVQLAYLVYVSTIGLIGNLGSYQWKSRQYNH